MSVTVTSADGVTVLTMTTDPKSACPPLCQILKGLCCSPTCCSVSQRLKVAQNASQSVLGALHILVGLLHIGLGVILACSHPAIWWDMNFALFPFWFGALFMLFGTMSILSEKRPSPCVVITNVVLNLAGVGFAIAAIVLYSISMAITDLWWMCEHNDDYDDYKPSLHDTTPSPEERYMTKKCLESEDVVLRLLTSINGMLIALSVLELCLVISSAVLGIKALRSSKKKENESTIDPEHVKPLLEEVTSDPTA